MSHQPEFIANLIYEHLSNTLTAEQEAVLQEWLLSSPGNARYFDSIVSKLRSGELSKEYFSVDTNKIWQRIIEQVPEFQSADDPTIITPLRPRRIRKWAIAAALAAIAATGAWFVFFHHGIDQATTIAVNAGDDVLPGGDKAILILGDGKKITLDSANNGQMLMQETVSIVQTAEGKLQYRQLAGEKPITPLFNTIMVPAGGRFRLELPDGSQVWLNAQSSLKYPVSFDGAARHVELKGEAYFEIAKKFSSNQKERVPFTVAVQSATGEPLSTIEVLGTHFNISAYNSTLRTTLTEGKVKVMSQSGSSALLLPGQQSVQEGLESLTVNQHADAEQATAWVNGWFNFNDAHISEIMEEAARWYSLKVVYQGDVTNKHYSLNLPRNLPISKMLQVLQMTGSIQFNIDKSAGTITIQN